MKLTKLYTIFNLIIAIINSIGKKWNNELNQIWKEQLNKWWKHLYIYIIIDLILLLAYLMYLIIYLVGTGVPFEEIWRIIIISK